MDPKLNLHEGPYKVISYNKENGTLHIQQNNYVEPINIRNVDPTLENRIASDIYLSHHKLHLLAVS
jgi:hypothetical protein